MRRGLGLGLEPPELLRVHRRRERQDLQGHPAAQRDLLGLVDDPHAAAADLAEDAEVAQGAQLGRERAQARRYARRRQPAGRDAELGHHLHRRQQPTDRVGLLRILRQDRRTVHRLARLEPVRHLLDHVVEDGVVPLVIECCRWARWTSSSAYVRSGVTRL